MFPSSQEVLLAVPFTELCWEYEEPQFDVDDDSFPALLLQFLVTEQDEDGRPRQVTKVLQVYSRQVGGPSGGWVVVVVWSLLYLEFCKYLSLSVV